MYARSTTVIGPPDSIDVGIAQVRDVVLPAVSDMEGYVGLSMLADRDSGRVIVTTAWRDVVAMRTTERRGQSLREHATQPDGRDRPRCRSGRSG